jgi:hypothetical protein
MPLRAQYTWRGKSEKMNVFSGSAASSLTSAFVLSNSVPNEISALRDLSCSAAFAAG